jgi:hypothetical protein
MEKPITASLQFKISSNRDTFEIQALEFNGIPQNKFVQQALLARMFE